MRRLSYAATAKADLEAINGFLREQANGRVAMRQLELIRARANRLIEFPELGPAFDEGPFRTLRVGGTPYTLVYVFTATEVRIVRVHHGAQDWRETIG